MQARLAHFYEVMREAELDVQDRDRLLARKLLLEMGALETPSDELTETVAKLCRFTVEHALKSDPGTLQDEMSADAPSNDSQAEPQQQRSRGRNDRSGGRGAGGGGRRGGSGGGNRRGGGDRWR